MRLASCDLWTHFAPVQSPPRPPYRAWQAHPGRPGSLESLNCEAVNQFTASVGLTGFHVSKMQIATSDFLISPS